MGFTSRNPDRYIYPAVRHGLTWNYLPDLPAKGAPLAKPLDLPPEIAAGLDATKPNLIERRKAWNKPAPGDYALPTEIWREVVARRQRYEEVRRKLAAGEVREVNDFITLNLDLRQFAQDVITNSEGPELLARCLARHRASDRSGSYLRFGRISLRGTQHSPTSL